MLCSGVTFPTQAPPQTLIWHWAGDGGQGHRIGLGGAGQSLLLSASDHFSHLSGLTGQAAFSPGSHIALLSQATGQDARERDVSTPLLGELQEFSGSCWPSLVGVGSWRSQEAVGIRQDKA